MYLSQLIQAVKTNYSEDLTQVFIDCCSNDIHFCTQFYWLANVEVSTNKNEDAGCQNIESLFSILFIKKGGVSLNVKNSIGRQHNLIQKLQELFITYHDRSKPPKEIQEIFINLLQNEYSFLQSFEPVEFPLDSTKVVCGIDPNDVKVFQSKLRPVVLGFHLKDGGKYRVLFKNGDDMRQDQIVIQLFDVMDGILRSDGVDFHVTPYKVLAFNDSFGCCEFVDSTRAIFDIVVTDKHTILDFLNTGDQNLAEKIDIYVKSLAAYSVMTYILLVGDRHTNNIIVHRDGRLIHIDFGFILGDVTKPFSPKIRLSREMIDFLGEDSFDQVLHWAIPAFQTLRSKAKLILVLLELMFTAPLKCFQGNPIQRLKLVEDCFLLNLSANDARLSLTETFKDSKTSKLQMVYDFIHSEAVKLNGPSAEQ